ncbi:uncharacterized protein LOC104582573 [Brachypodium distachyon]|uniref:uncharacterized protein LOC104582573 n=1 Tax=Brachypodium distachyon TaxID=15368 RepID=UPI00053004AF|nr:uncharacterized protein LOC104582573 [Brachypodium distachyon]|eukprot:XP_024314203.1 uncharacterized protein LOC104582573 [Brachypodium distachyon]
MATAPASINLPAQLAFAVGCTLLSGAPWQGPCPPGATCGPLSASAGQHLVPPTPPPSGWLKLNVDASYHDDDGRGAWGAILRDHTGTIVGSAWDGSVRCLGAATTEALAARDGLRSLRHLIRGPLYLESDCIALTRELAQPLHGRSPTSLLAAEILDMLRSLDDFCISKTPRSTNTAAHDIATFAWLGVSLGVLTGSAPVFLLA